jgi:mono/diheme cytochrome c family protein
MRNAVLFLAAALPLAAAASDTGFEKSVRPFLKEYCIECHGPRLAMAERRFDSLGSDLSSVETQQRWKAIVDRLNLGKMPPAGAKQPDDARRREVIDWMTSRLAAAWTQNRSTGARTVLRRLNRYEYGRTVRELLALDGMLADPTDVFPPDAVDEGFTNIGSALLTSDFLLTGYLSAAEVFIDRAIAEGPRPEMRKYTFHAPFHPTGNRHDGQDVPGRYQNIRKNTMGGGTPEGGFLWLDNFLQGVPHDGYYRLRFKAQGINRNYPYDPRIVQVEKSEPLRVAVVAGSAKYGWLSKPTTSDRQLAEYELPDDAPKWFETRIWLDRGYQPRLSFPNGPTGVKPLRRALILRYYDQFPDFVRDYVVEGSPVTPKTVLEGMNRTVSKEGASKTELTTAGTGRSFNTRQGWSTFFREYMGPRVRVYEIELEGPLFDTWPPPSRAAVFGSYAPTLDHAEPILRRFAWRAFRRPVTDDELKPLLALVRQRAQKGDSPVKALSAGLRGVLCSPSFLYLRENDGALDDYALASRLSYFLWSSMPDEELMQAAAAGKLRRAGVLRAQALRMLDSPKAEALDSQFTSRWLELYKIGSMPPSPKDHQNYYIDGLDQAMKTEARLYFRHILQNNLPIERFIDSDFTFVNGGLARLYNIPDVHGVEFRNVRLPDRRRGGLLGMAGVLTASANGIDTSPVVRGVWVLRNILGTPPTPPPPDVKPLDPDIRGASTIRDQLLKHRHVATCNSCHAKIDPPGFALENFDPIGGWRDRYPRMSHDAPKVDASGRLAGGDSFIDVVSFKDVLLHRHRDQFARCLTEKLLAYSMGRRLEPSDAPQVDRLVAALQERGNGMRDLLLLVVESEPFGRK